MFPPLSIHPFSLLPENDTHARRFAPPRLAEVYFLLASPCVVKGRKRNERILGLSDSRLGVLHQIVCFQ